MKKNIFFALSLFHAVSSTHAELVVVSDTTVGSPTYNRIFSAAQPSLSAIGSDVNFSVVPFLVGADGLYRLEVVQPTLIFDPVLTLYIGSFDPAAPTDNVIAYNDDVNFPDTFPQILTNLSTNDEYFAVISSFNNGDSDEFTFEIEGLSIFLGLLNPFDSLYAAFALPNLGHSIAQASVNNLGQHLQQLQFQHVDTAGNLQDTFPLVDQSRQWSLWAQGNFGSFEQSRDNWNSDSDIYTGTVGADYFFSETFTAGLALGHTEASADLGNDAGDIESDGQFAAIYASYQLGNFYAHGLYSYGLHSMDLDRKTNIQVNQVNDIDAQMHTVNLSGGYNMYWNRVSYGPVVSVKYNHVQTDSYSEPNSGYTIEQQTLESLTTELGAQASHTFYTDNGLIVPQIKALWVHEFKDGSEDVDLSGAAVATSERTSPYDEDYFIVGIGVHWQSLNNPLRIGVSYESQLRAGSNDAKIASIFGSWAW